MASEWILPTCRAQLILSEDRSLFVGPKTRAELIERRTDQRAWGVSLVAGAAAVLLAVGGDESSDDTVPLEAVWSFGSLVERLSSLAGPAGLAELETALLKGRAGSASPMLAGPRALIPSIFEAERAIRLGAAAVAVPGMLGVDRRRLVPSFRRSVGVGMKHYERVCRFNRSVSAMRHRGAPPLAVLAAELGLADQAHLTREVVHFAGVSPKRLHRDGGEMVNHVMRP